MTEVRSFAEEIFKNLPQRDCGKCGNQLCSEFALQLLKDKQKVEECPYVNDEQTQAITLILDEYFSIGT